MKMKFCFCKKIYSALDICQTARHLRASSTHFSTVNKSTDNLPQNTLDTYALLEHTQIEFVLGQQQGLLTLAEVEA